MKSEELRLQGVHKSYGSVKAVSDVSLVVEPGTTLTLLGPSGCGKTTLLRMIAGFVYPSAGRIFVGGSDITDVPAARRDVGVVFQNYALFPHLTIAENLGFGLRARKRPKEEVKHQVQRMLSLVKLDGFADRYPNQLSGGQQQRAAVARALAIDPRLLLLDEPLSALDKNLRQAVQQELRQLQRQLGITTVVVTHDQEEAFVLSDRVAVMNAGRVLQVGTPQEVYDKPSNRFVAEFLGSGNFLNGTIVASSGGRAEIEVVGGARFQVASNLPPGARVEVFVRPEEVILEPRGSVEALGAASIDVTLVESRLVGGRVEVEVECAGGTRLLAHKLRQGRSVQLGMPGVPLRASADLNSLVVMPV